MANKTEKWVLAADRGGTFTDIVAFAPNGRTHTLKLLSRSPRYEDALIEGMRRLLGKDAAVKTVKIGTTVGTNALLERKGEPVCLVTTIGFGDILQIGYQDRPFLFKLDARKPAPLACQVVEVKERIDAKGKILEHLEQEDARRSLKLVYDTGIRSLAIVLLHSWKNPENERKLAAIACEVGFSYISCSSTVMPLIKIVGRGRTAVVDAYITPILRNYLDKITAGVPGTPVKCMQSNGGIVDASSFRGRDAILSGPAGGVVGFSHVAELAGFSKAIGFDMGGTSTDVARFDGKYEKIFEAEISSIQFQADMLNVVTVAAGGGSVLKFDGRKMTVGPDSAGAIPGPACYRAKGPLAVTDANLMLGRIIARFFPKVFGKSGSLGLDVETVREQFRETAKKIALESGKEITPEQVAEGFIRIANENMGQAIKKVSVARGFDLREYALVCFGGAGAQHACAIARALGISTIVLPPLAGLLSAYGIALANTVRTGAQSVLMPFVAPLDLQERFFALESPLVEATVTEGIARKNVSIARYLDIRPKGTESWETVPWGTFDKVSANFHKLYFRHYGMVLAAKKELEIANIRVEVTGIQEKLQPKPIPLQEKTLTVKDALEPEHRAYFWGEYHRCPVFSRTQLKPGHQIVGPAIVVEDHSTVVVEPGFVARANEYEHLLLKRIENLRVERVSTERDPVMLEIFNNLFRSIAQQMGAALLKTAHSTNIKERMDFSCAIFDPDGGLVANAPHIPVHLGAMGETVRHIICKNLSKMCPGDVYVSNNPFTGGSHLPDVTVVTPVFNSENKLIFTVASRGHHADIGGITPGSMPPFSTSIYEEGVVLDDFLLVCKGEFREREIKEVLGSGKYPARNVEERISDLCAQIAANNKGVRELEQTIAHYGLTVVQAYMRYIQENAACAMRKALGKFVAEKPIVVKKFRDYLDDGSKIQVSILIKRGKNPPHTHRATIDFAGTSSRLPGNLNAPTAVTKAAVLYVLRTLIEEDIPLNAGCLEPIVIKIPENSLLDPKSPAAVAGGNVETSQRIVDVLCGALDIAAASQGTMNNWTFGKEGDGGFGYYETVCGGAGAGPDFPGEHAVHTHMTNTRITDPEVLEHRYPEVRVEQFSIRRNSGGAGQLHGGDGTIRRIHFLKPRNVTILSERRSIPPYGLKGGQPGKRGLNTVTDANGWEQALPAKTALVINAGEVLTIYTPGGGGYGKPHDARGSEPK